MKVYILMEDRFHAPSFIYGVYSSEEKALLEAPFDESFNINALMYEFEIDE